MHLSVFLCCKYFSINMKTIDFRKKALFCRALPFLSLVSVIVLFYYVGILKPSPCYWLERSSEFFIRHQFKQNITNTTTTVESQFGIGDKVVSMCSSKADERGFHQNVIAYSLYGNISDPKVFSRYVDPIKSILVNISQSYPDWIVRIYSALDNDNQLGNLKLKNLLHNYSFVDLCNVSQIIELQNISQSLEPMTWRFLPLLDPTVDRFLSRDSDSLILNREVAAVMQWLSKSEATFHIMRDHADHCIEILAGMWGAKVYQKRKLILDAAIQLFYQNNHETYYGFDQHLLTKIIWPLTLNDSIVHDSYCFCGIGNTTRPFPSKRHGTDYVGKVVHQELVQHPLPKICPENCRPKEHPDWIYC